MNTRIDVRLLPAERELVQTLQSALSTPLLPRVSASDVIRAGLRALQDHLGAGAAA